MGGSRSCANERLRGRTSKTVHDLAFFLLSNDAFISRPSITSLELSRSPGSGGIQSLTLSLLNYGEDNALPVVTNSNGGEWFSRLISV